MNSFRQHIPDFVDMDRPGPIPFETTADLLALEVVQRYKRADFSHFAIDGQCLMVITDDGFEWWVVGFLAEPSAVDLPHWDGGKYLARLANGEERILTDITQPRVQWSADIQLGLTDGTVATDVRRVRARAKQAADRKLEAAGMCAKCHVSYTVEEVPIEGGKIEVRDTCPTCGRTRLTWRPGKHIMVEQDA